MSRPQRRALLATAVIAAAALALTGCSLSASAGDSSASAKDGGIDGHPVALKYEDSQSDPYQSVTVAQKFVNDSDVVLVFGDYSSAASIPASPIYTAGKLVQYGFN
ncbi:MAG: ABC transporter substrate-binding protein, partial [Microbacterium sp.]|nr:ABC transporter substrate-binding protein [Microbacterium sp.]